MQDFRDSPFYSIFSTCRTDTSRYEKALDALGEIAGKDKSTVKRAAIEALAFNESCAKSEKKIDFSGSPENLRAAAGDAFLSYRERVKAENETLAAIMRDDLRGADSHALRVLSASTMERSKFSALKEVLPPGAVGQSSWLLWVAVCAIAFLVMRGMTRKAQDPTSTKDSPGVIRSIGRFFKGFAGDLKNEYKTLNSAISQASTSEEKTEEERKDV